MGLDSTHVVACWRVADAQRSSSVGIHVGVGICDIFRLQVADVEARSPERVSADRWVFTGLLVRIAGDGCCGFSGGQRRPRVAT